jgi:hypothetical protein
MCSSKFTTTKTEIFKNVANKPTRNIDTHTDEFALRKIIRWDGYAPHNSWRESDQTDKINNKCKIIDLIKERENQ